MIPAGEICIHHLASLSGNYDRKFGVPGEPAGQSAILSPALSKGESDRVRKKSAGG